MDTHKLRIISDDNVDSFAFRSHERTFSQCTDVFVSIVVSLSGNEEEVTRTLFEQS